MSSSSASASAALASDGFCLLRDVLDPPTLEAVRSSAQERLSELLRALLLQQVVKLQQGDGPVATRFQELVERDGGRLDIRHNPSDDVISKILRSCHPDLITVLTEALGEECEVLAAGNVTAMSTMGWLEAGLADGDDEDGEESSNIVMADNLGAQAWHADGPHLFEAPDVQLPPHGVTIFFPLVDLSEENGPTEFAPGSHVRGHEYAGAAAEAQDGEGSGEAGTATTATRTPLAKAGDAIVFDYRTWHRGTPNCSEADRPVLYLVVGRKWWVDSRNYNQDESLSSIFAAAGAARAGKNGGGGGATSSKAADSGALAAPPAPRRVPLLQHRRSSADAEPEASESKPSPRSAGKRPRGQ